jgi:hypothetical protein
VNWKRGCRKGVIMRGKGCLNLNKRLEQPEKTLEINEVQVHYASEPIAIGPEDRVIKLRWMDVPELDSLDNTKKIR